MHVRNPDKNFIPGPHLVEGIALSLSPREEHLPFSITPHVLRAQSWMLYTVFFTQSSLPSPKPTMIIVLKSLEPLLYLDDIYSAECLLISLSSLYSLVQ